MKSACYRPISIVPCIGQILEKHIFNIITNIFDRYSVISPNQYGFITGRGTQPLLEDFSDNLCMTFEKNLVPRGFFLDMSKAFDAVSLRILCDKLYKLGIRGSSHALNQNYLSGHTQIVSVGRYRGRKVILRAAVPQGSIISPPFLNVYTNYLPKVIRECKIFRYADDTLLLSRHINYSGSVILLQRDATNLMNWYGSNLIRINSNKLHWYAFVIPISMYR